MLRSPWSRLRVCIYTLSVPRCAGRCGSTPHGEGSNPGYMYVIRRCRSDQITVLSCQTSREGRQTGSNRAVRPQPSKMASFSALHRNRLKTADMGRAAKLAVRDGFGHSARSMALCWPSRAARHDGRVLLSPHLRPYKYLIRCRSLWCREAPRTRRRWKVQMQDIFMCAGEASATGTPINRVVLFVKALKQVKVAPFGHNRRKW